MPSSLRSLGMLSHISDSVEQATSRLARCSLAVFGESADFDEALLPTVSMDTTSDDAELFGIFGMVALGSSGRLNETSGDLVALCKSCDDGTECDTGSIILLGSADRGDIEVDL